MNADTIAIENAKKKIEKEIEETKKLIRSCCPEDKNEFREYINGLQYAYSVLINARNAAYYGES